MGKTVPNKAYGDTEITRNVWLGYIGPGNSYQKYSKRYRATYNR
jgi:hypothetical protein